MFENLIQVSPWLPILFIIVCIIFFTSGVVMYLLVPIRARKQAREILEDFDAMTEQLTQGEHIGHFGSFHWDTGSGKGQWSEELYALFGLHVYNKAPDIRWINTAIIETQRGEFSKQWEYAISHVGPFNIVAHILKPDGAPRHLRLIGKTSDRPNISFDVSGVAHDITKETEVDRAKSEFVSIASHQLKTPLTSIAWLAESLLANTSKNTLTPDQEKYISSILQTSRHMMEMVNDLLNVSRIELGALVIRPEDLDINILFQSVYTEQKKAIEDKQINFIIKIEEGLPHMLADKSFVRMILQNLITNAVKYTPAKGTVTVDISKDVSMHTDVFVIKIVDSGIGIPAKDQPHVFTRMYRASNAQSTVTDGTGLGLYVIKSIVERVKGKISFISTEGIGTTFFVTIPIQWDASSPTTIDS